MGKSLKILVAVVLGLLAAVTNVVYINSKLAAIEVAGEKVPVLVASEDIAAGTTLEPENFSVKQFPGAYVQPEAATREEDVAGLVSLTAIKAGEQILKTKLSGSSQEHVENLIPPGENLRAVSFQVDEVDGVDGFVRPGVHVDVLGVFEIDNEDGPRNAQVTEVRLVEPSMLVLAVDRRTQRQRLPKPERRAGLVGESPTEERFVGVVTVLADAPTAQRLVLARTIGKLSLLLRRPGDTSPVRLEIYDQNLLLPGRRLWREAASQGAMFESLMSRPGAGNR